MSRVCVLLERGTPPRFNPVLGSALELVEAAGHHVTTWYPEEDLIRLDTLRITADVYLLKSDSELSLSLATALEYMGARVINRARASALAKDKLRASLLLAAAGIPAAPAWAAARPTQLASYTPLIFKPHRGYHGAGIAITANPARLPGDNAYPDVTYAQRYLTDGRRDLKVFGIGEHIFGVRKAFAANSFLEAGEPVALSEDVERIARDCARAFDLELFGLDVAEDPRHGPLVIDVNYFPGYRGVPAAGHLLADHIRHVLTTT